MLDNELVVGIVLATICERITEWGLALLFAAFADLKTYWKVSISDGIKALLTALVNAGLYLLFFHHIDFVSPLMRAIGVPMDPWQGLALGTILVAGGSNLVHQFFSFFKARR